MNIAGTTSIALALALSAAPLCAQDSAERNPYLAHFADQAGKDSWVQLFNGENLDGWEVKFTGSELGENFRDTFRVEDGLLSVDYSNWDQPFAGEFGHLFTEDSYSHYVLRAEYRFTGDQVEGGPGWANRNNGLMIHGEPASMMRLDQDFPCSVEVQLLGAFDQGERTTGNICTPGTYIHLDDELITSHCIEAESPSYRGDQWVTIEVVVNGGEDIRHYVNGEEVIHYGGTELAPNEGIAADMIAARTEAGNDSLELNEGTISIQAETAPCQFRSIELLPLEASDFDDVE